MNGSYAVKVTKNGCVDTSSCVSFTSVGIEQFTLENQLMITPNPTKGNIYISFGNLKGIKQYTVRNMVGQVIQRSSTSSDLANINLTTENGIYFIEVELSNGQRAIRKIVKH